jgi:hypothetical protein
MRSVSVIYTYKELDCSWRSYKVGVRRVTNVAEIIAISR